MTEDREALADRIAGRNVAWSFADVQPVTEDREADTFAVVRALPFDPGCSVCADLADGGDWPVTSDLASHPPSCVMHAAARIIARRVQ